MFRIKIFESVHNCQGIGYLGHNNVSAKFIANYIVDKLKFQPDYRPSAIVKDIKDLFHVEIDYNKAYRAKELTLGFINGTYEDAYKSLPKYCQDIERTNPNSLVKLEATSDNKFKCIFICYSACAQGFAFCRPLLCHGLDGATGCEQGLDDPNARKREDRARIRLTLDRWVGGSRKRGE